MWPIPPPPPPDPPLQEEKEGGRERERRGVLLPHLSPVFLLQFFEMGDLASLFFFFFPCREKRKEGETRIKSRTLSRRQRTENKKRGWLVVFFFRAFPSPPPFNFRFAFLLATGGWWWFFFLVETGFKLARKKMPAVSFRSVEISKIWRATIFFPYLVQTNSPVKKSFKKSFPPLFCLSRKSSWLPNLGVGKKCQFFWSARFANVHILE